MSLTQNELDILRHALGLNYQAKPFRNHFCTGPGSADHPTYMALVDKGLMVRRPPSLLTGGDDLFVVTVRGRAVVMDAPPVRKTRSQLRYERWLDADCDIPFGRWLRTEPRP